MFRLGPDRNCISKKNTSHILMNSNIKVTVLLISTFLQTSKTCKIDAARHAYRPQLTSETLFVQDGSDCKLPE